MKNNNRSRKEDFVIFGGNSNPLLTNSICNYLKVEPGKAKVTRFSDGETQIEILENIRKKDIYVVQSTCPPNVNDFLVELFILIDAFKRTCDHDCNIIAVIPYFGYARQDKKVQPRVPITAKLVADLLEKAGARRIITADLHAEQIQGFFNCPVDNLHFSYELLDHLKEIFKDAISAGNLVVVSPDTGGVERARFYAKRLNAGLAIIDKRRSAPNQAKAMHIIGDVNGKIAIVLDDMIDTAGTLTEAGRVVMENGAKEVHAGAVHPVFSGKAIERIMESPFESIHVSDSIPLSNKASVCKKIKVHSIAKLVGEAIIRCHKGDSVSSLFIQ